jgi:glycosyltransferase involved in cell wall biosynthesis
MRVLHVNKFLYRRGGAESYMEDLAELQRNAGDEVEFFGMAHPQNPALRYARHFPSYIEMDPPPSGLTAQVRGVARMLHSSEAARGMAAVLDDFRPDVVHLHNIYHQLSPSLLRPVARRGIPAVMTLHDYKLACPSYQFLDHGMPCQACLGGHFQHAVLRRCKGGSLPASLAVAVELSVHTLLRSYGPVQRFICPSAFLAGRMRAAGVFPQRLRHIPHFIDVSGLPVKSTPGGPLLVAGRLSKEKGVDIVVEALRSLPDATLDVAGTGPEEQRLRRLADVAAPGRVRFHGLVPKQRVRELMLGATAVCMPSRWYENQPMTVLEAQALGVPVVASDLGGLPELVEDGVNGALATADDAASFATALRPFVTDAAHGFAMRDGCRRHIEEAFSPAAHLHRIADVYDQAARAVTSAAA